MTDIVLEFALCSLLVSIPLEEYQCYCLIDFEFECCVLSLYCDSCSIVLELLTCVRCRLLNMRDQRFLSRLTLNIFCKRYRFISPQFYGVRGSNDYSIGTVGTCLGPGIPRGPVLAEARVGDQIDRSDPEA